MNQQPTEHDQAESDLLSCAAFLTKRIKNHDGYAEAVKEILPYYLKNNDVDTAAELVDVINDSFTRDQFLGVIAEKCAEINDDEYALQLADAVEDINLQSIALEKIAAQKAAQKQFPQAFEIAVRLDHASNVYAEIAAHQEEPEALKTIEKIEYPFIKSQALRQIALNSNNPSLLNLAIKALRDVELDEEKIGGLISIAYAFVEAKVNERAIDVFENAKQIAETLDSVKRDNFLSQISRGFLDAGSLSLADAALDLVEDKTEIAKTLVGYAIVYQEKGELAEALEILDEAYQILKSQRETETRDSRAKFDLFGAIATHFANMDEVEKAIEIALENPYQEIRCSTLAQISQLALLDKYEEHALQAVAVIDDETEKTAAMMNLSDVFRRIKEDAKALKQLEQAYAKIDNVRQLTIKSLILNRLAGRFNAFGESEKARNICTESLQIVSKILDRTNQVSSLAKLADTFSSLKFELNDAEKEVLRFIVQKASI